MRILVTEDDFVSRKLISSYLSRYGECDIAADGKEALFAVELLLKENKHYDLICLDIMTPNMDGHEALRKIREIEERYGRPLGTGAKIVMTTALSDSKSILESFKDNCDAYLVKPVKGSDIKNTLQELNLI